MFFLVLDWYIVHWCKEGYYFEDVDIGIAEVATTVYLVLNGGFVVGLLYLTPKSVGKIFQIDIHSNQTQKAYSRIDEVDCYIVDILMNICWLAKDFPALQICFTWASYCDFCSKLIILKDFYFASLVTYSLNS